jgi:hypothetical protein
LLFEKVCILKNLESSGMYPEWPGIPDCPELRPEIRMQSECCQDFRADSRSIPGTPDLSIYNSVLSKTTMGDV